MSTRSRQIGEILKKERKRHGWSVNDVVILLRDQYQLDVAAKTIYGWESDQSYPRTETLLGLCELYHREDLAEGLLDNSDGGFRITMDERDMIIKYRQHPELQSVVKRVLDVPPNEEEAS
jgi:transcriptional regulator with XRE-family HTH domain